VFGHDGLDHITPSTSSTYGRIDALFDLVMRRAGWWEKVFRRF